MLNGMNQHADRNEKEPENQFFCSSYLKWYTWTSVSCIIGWFEVQKDPKTYSYAEGVNAKSIRDIEKLKSMYHNALYANDLDDFKDEFEQLHHTN